MARFSRRQLSATNGEVSPRLHGRADMEFFYAALAECFNFIPDHKGNLVRRPPTRFVTKSKNNEKPCLYNFNVGRNCPVIIEAYRDCFRFIIAREVVLDGGAPLEVPHTYGDDYCDLEVTQDCGALFIAHENHVPAILKKDGGGFTLEEFPSLPFGELNGDSTCRVCLEKSGANEPAGASVNFFSPTLRFDPFNAASVPTINPGDVLEASDGTQFTIGAQTSLFFRYFVTGNFSAGNYTIVTVNGTDLDPADVYDVTAVEGVANLKADGCNPFNANWVGQQVRVLDEVGVGSDDDGNGGNEPNTWITVEVLEYINSSHIIVQYSGDALRCTDLFQPPAFADGVYPETVQAAFGRLWLASENCLFGSESGNFFGWQPTDEFGEVNPDNAILYKITAGECNDIRWLRPMGRQLLVGTDTDLISLYGSGAGGVFQAGAIVEQQNEKNGSSDVSPEQVGAGVLFVDRSRTKIYSTGFAGQYDQIGAIELTLYSDHIGDRRFKRIAYQEHPYSVLWAVLDDGGLASVTTVQGQNVRGWARHGLGGSLIVDGCCREPEVCDVVSGFGPNAETDDIYLVVKRTINGQDTFFIEVLGEYYSNVENWKEYGHLDCYLPLGNISSFGGSLASGPSPFSPPVGVTGSFSVYDGQEWIEYVEDGANVQAVAPNTTKGPVLGRDWFHNGTDWIKYEKPNPCEEAPIVPHGSPVFRAPCGANLIAECVDRISGLDDFEGEWLSIYADGRQSFAQVQSGEVAKGGCVVRAGFEYESRAALLPHRTNLGSTDGANDPQRPVEVALYVMDAVHVESANSDGTFERMRFDVEEIDRPVPFSGWAEVSIAHGFNDNDESGVSFRVLGPWPCIVRNIEVITEAQGGR